MNKHIKYYNLYLILLLLLSSCNKSNIDNLGETNKDGVIVNFSADTKSIEVDSETDLIPMSRADYAQDYNDFCFAGASHIIMKKPGTEDEYLVVKKSEIACHKKGSNEEIGFPLNIRMKDYEFRIQPEVLQPGEYKSMIVINSGLNINVGDNVDSKTNIINEYLFLRPRSIYIDKYDFTVTKNGVLNNPSATELIEYKNTQRYTTPINIILETGNDKINSYTLTGTFNYDYPSYINYNGEIIYDNIQEKSPINMSVSYNILTKNPVWNFAEAGSELDNPRIYPLIYTKDKKELNVKINITQINQGYDVFYNKNISFDVNVKNGKPCNVLLNFTDKTGPIIETDTKAVNSLWEKAQTEPFIPLNYVEYNKSNL